MYKYTLSFRVLPVLEGFCRGGQQTGPKVIKVFPCLTQMSMKFYLLKQEILISTFAQFS